MKGGNIMSLATKIKKIELDGEKFLLTIDMMTINYFKDKTGKSFLKSITNMTELDEDIIFPMIGGMLRTEENPIEPMGVNSLMKYDPIGLISFITPFIAELVGESMPTDHPSSKGNSKKK